MPEALLGGVVGSVGGLFAALIVASHNDWKTKRDALSLVSLGLAKYLSLLDAFEKSVSSNPRKLGDGKLLEHMWVVVQRPRIADHITAAIATAVNVDDTLTLHLHAGLLVADLAEREFAEVELFVRRWRAGEDWDRDHLLDHLQNGRDFAKDASQHFAKAAGRCDAIIESKAPTILLQWYRLQRRFGTDEPKPVTIGRKKGRR